MENTQELREHLKEAVEEIDISISELARQAGLNKSTVSRLLSGACDPNPSTLRAVADVIGADTDRLMILAGYVPEDARPRSKQELELFRKLREMDGKQFKQTSNYANSMHKQQRKQEE